MFSTALLSKCDYLIFATHIQCLLKNLVFQGNQENVQLSITILKVAIVYSFFLVILVLNSFASGSACSTSINTGSDISISKFLLRNNEVFDVLTIYRQYQLTLDMAFRSCCNLECTVVPFFKQQNIQLIEQ